MHEIPPYSFLSAIATFQPISTLMKIIVIKSNNSKWCATVWKGFTSNQDAWPRFSSKASSRSSEEGEWKNRSWEQEKGQRDSWSTKENSKYKKMIVWSQTEIYLCVIYVKNINHCYIKLCVCFSDSTIFVTFGHQNHHSSLCILFYILWLNPKSLGPLA